MTPSVTSSAPSRLSTCKWRERRSDSPNPLEYQLDSKPVIPWRRPKGRECGICPWAIDADEELRKAKTDGTLEQKMLESEFNKLFHEKLDRWLAEKNRTGGGRMPAGAMREGRKRIYLPMAGQEQGSRCATVVRREERGTEGRARINKLYSFGGNGMWNRTRLRRYNLL